MAPASKRTVELLVVMAIASLTAGCARRGLDTQAVESFVNQADDAARKRFALEICALRARDFHEHVVVHNPDSAQVTELSADRKTYCRDAQSFSHLPRYVLERKSLQVDLAADRRSARVTAEYIEKLPFYRHRPASGPDDYMEVQIHRSHETSVVGLEDGRPVFKSTDVDVSWKLVPRSEMPLPAD
jgi:hypothetical protein